MASDQQPEALEILRARLEREHSALNDEDKSEQPSSDVDAVLEFRSDSYNGVNITASRLPTNSQEFLARLTSSLERWQTEGRRGVWLKIPVELVEFVPLAIKHCGFTSHHSTASYFMLTRWLPSTPCPLPSYANSNIGVGGWVEDGTGRVLVVQERTGPTAGMDFWKLPGGMMECDEHLATASIREVLEETGIACTFERLLCFQQTGHGPFGVNSFYAICRLRPIDSTEIKIQESEIARACWMPIEELVQKPYYQSGVLRTLIKVSAASGQHPEEGLAAATRPLFFRSGDATIFAAAAAINRADPPTDLSSL